MYDRAKQWFITPMTALYPPPRGTTDPEKALEIYCRELERFTAEELDEGFKSLSRGYAGRVWPPLPDCIKFCRDVKERTRPSGKPVLAVDNTEEKPMTPASAREFMEVYHKLEQQAKDGKTFRFNGLDINPQAGNRIRGLARAMYERNRSEYDRLTGDQP